MMTGLKLKGLAVAAFATFLAAPSSQAQTNPPVLGTYTGSGALSRTSCADPNDDASVSLTAGVIFTSGSGSVVVGVSTLTTTVAGVTATATATLTGTIGWQGSLSGSFTYIATVPGLLPAQGSGAFTGAVSGNTLTMQFTLTPADSCQLAGSVAAVDVTRAPDFDGDGHADTVIHDRTSGNWFVGRSSGGRFVPALWVTGFGNRGPLAEEAFSGDFSGDGRTDLAIHDRTSGQWFIGRSTGTSFTIEQWAAGFGTGGAAEETLTGDFTGDGRVDAAIRNRFTGDWFVGRSTGAAFAITQWAARFGTLGDVEEAFVGDFTGDGKADVAIHNRQTGDWFVGRSTGSSFTVEPWVSRFGTLGSAVEEVFVGDFTGDGKADVAIHNRQTGDWFIGRSTGTAFTVEQWAAGFGNAGDPEETFAADFTGDGKADVAIHNRQTGGWFIGRSTGSSFAVELWAVGFGNLGAAREEAFVGDVTGDGRADAAVHDRVTGEWFVGRSTGSSFGVEPFVSGFGNMGGTEEVVAGQIRRR